MDGKIYSLYVSDGYGQTHELDLENIDISTIYNLEDLVDVEGRNDVGSKEFTIKGTKQNNMVLGHIYDLSKYFETGNDDFYGYSPDYLHAYTPNKQIKAVLFENNIQLMKGTFLVKSVDRDGNDIKYSCILKGNVVSFFNDISNRYLHELDSLDDTFETSLTNIINSWDVGNNLKYILPMIDYGMDDRVDYDGNMEDERIIINYWDRHYDYKNFRPAIYLKAYLDAIFKGFNNESQSVTQFKDGNVVNKYSYESTFFDSPNFKKLFIPYNEENYQKSVNGTWCTITMSNFNGTIFFNSAMAITPQNFTFSSDYFRNGKIASYTPSKGFTTIKQTNVSYIRPIDQGIKTTLRLTMNIKLSPDTKGKIHVGLMDIKSRDFIAEDSFIAKYTTIKTDTMEENHTVDILIDKPFDVNGEYAMALLKESGDPFIKIDITNMKLEWGYGSTTNIPVSRYDTLNIFDYIPRDIKIVDFLKSLMTMFNLMIIQHPEIENKYIIKTYNDFYKDILNVDTTNSVDWSNKVDLTKYNLQTNINLPKAYIYSYEEDDDMMNERYTTLYKEPYGNKRISNPKGSDGDKEIKMIFSPTINLNTTDNSKSLPCLFTADDWLTGKKKSIKTNLRLMYNNGVILSPEYEIHYRTHPLMLMTTYNYCSMYSLDSEGMIDEALVFDYPKDFYPSEYVPQYEDKQTLFSKYHSKQIEMVMDSNLMTLEISGYLNENDISEINFQNPIYLETENGNSLWKLLEVNYKNSISPCKIKLQKITV